MKRIVFQLLIVLFFANINANIFAQDQKEAHQAKIIPLSKMDEFHERDGLHNIFYKIATKRQVRIGYIGGSITAAREGWRDMTFNWFRITFPLTAFYQVDAAIGGTGSGLGSFRMEQDLLSEKPDLIFVEFAVNDAGETRERILRAMEGIVRQTWAKYPDTDICFVYTTALNMCNDLVKGKPQQSSGFMEEIASYYGIPSIHMGIQVAKLLVEGKLVFKADPSEKAHKIVFSRDGTHPLSESGHPIYASTVIKYLNKMSRHSAEKPHLLPEPMVADNWEKSKMIDLSKVERAGEWEKLPKQNELVQKFQHFMPAIYQAKPGSSMHFKFKGKVLGIYDCIGPGTGTIEVLIDGEKEEIYRFDAWCGDYRKHNFFLKELEDKVHEVEIRVLDKKIDKAPIMAKRKITITDPAKYAGMDWYPANVMIVGELVD